MMMQAAQAQRVLSVLMALGSALGWEAGWMYPVYSGPIAGGACLLYLPAFDNDRRLLLLPQCAVLVLWQVLDPWWR